MYEWPLQGSRRGVLFVTTILRTADAVHTAPVACTTAAACTVAAVCTSLRAASGARGRKAVIAVMKPLRGCVCMYVHAS